MKTLTNHQAAARLFLAGLAAATLLAASPVRATGTAAESNAATRATARPTEHQGVHAPSARAGTATSEPAPRAAASPTAPDQRVAAASCQKCRRAGSGGDVMMFWLMFGGVAKTGAPGAEAPPASGDAPGP